MLILSKFNEKIWVKKSFLYIISIIIHELVMIDFKLFKKC